MKTMTKRIVSMSLAVTMALLMLVSALPAKAFAAPATGELTITSTDASFNGKEVKAWQMFSATATADGNNANYTLASEWEPFFRTEIGGAMAGLSGDQLSQKAVEYVTGLGASDSAGVTAFAKKASDWAKEQQPQLSGTKTATASLSGDRYVARFADLNYGYYVVSPQTGSTDVTEPIRGTDAMLANVVKATQNVDLKSVYPTVDKTVNGGNHVDAQVGDVLNFALTSKVPDMSEYTTYVFNFKDVLSKGLTLNQNSIKVTIGQLELRKDVDYSVGVTGGNGADTKLTVSMIDFKTKHGDKAGQDIKVTYSAVLNEHAVVGMDDAKNEAKLEFSNNPGAPDSKGESTTDITHGYTFGFDIRKVDGKDKSALVGAKFQIRKKGQAAIKLIVENAGNDSDPAIVRPAKQEEIDKVPSDAVDTVTTPASGKITFKGFAAGVYELVETEAPAGYNKLDKPFEVTIEAKYAADGTLESWTLNKGANNTAIEIVNNKGALLPGTGGMGTILFTLVGAAAIGYGIYRKRTAKTVA